MDWSQYLVERNEKPLARQAAREKAFEIDKVYPGSLAEAAGLKPGYLFFPRDLETDDPLYLEDLKQKQLNRTVFADLERNVEIELLMVGFPFGIKLRRTMEGLCADIALGNDESEEILLRIHDGDDADFAMLVAALQRPFSKPAVKAIMSLFSGRSEPIHERYFVARMAVGVFHAMKGDVFQARELMAEFEEEDVRAGIMTSLYALGQAMIVEAEGGDEGKVIEWLRHALACYPKSRRIREALGRRTGTDLGEPETPEPRQFPLNYYLIERDPLSNADPRSCRFVSLNQTLSDLEKDQFLLVIALSTYRGNHYYIGVLIRFILIHHLVHGHFPVIHVITGFEKGGRHFNEWLAGEEIMQDIGIPFQVLHDPEHFVSAIVDADKSPYSLIVNKQGTIIHEGDLIDEEGYWTALSSLRQT